MTQTPASPRQRQICPSSAQCCHSPERDEGSSFETMASPKRCQILPLWNSSNLMVWIQADLQDFSWQHGYHGYPLRILQGPLVFLLVRCTHAPRQVCSRIAVTAEKRLGTSAAAFLGTAPPIAFALFRFIGLNSAGSLLTLQLTPSQSVCHGSATVAPSGIQPNKPAQHYFNVQLRSFEDFEGARRLNCMSFSKLYITIITAKQC